MLDLSSHFDLKLLSTLLFSSGLATAALILKSAPVKAFNFIKRKLVSTITVDSTCEAYRLLNDWIEAQAFSKASRSMLLENAKARDRGITTAAEDTSRADRVTSWRIGMGQGSYLFWHAGTLFVYTKTSNAPSGGAKAQTHHSTLLALSRNKHKLLAILDECHALLTENDSVNIYIHTGLYWSLADRRKPRQLETVFLKAGQVEKIVNDITWYNASESWYVERGIPYRRGYLFSGPPGTGKTSTIVALATHFKKKVYLINLGAMSSDRELMTAIAETPRDSYVVLEDVDCVKATHARLGEGTDESSRSERGLTMAGLLNALDGISTPEKRLYFLTTNHPAKLDPALLRPGRIDMHETIGKLALLEQEQMAACFYGQAVFEGLTEPLSAATLQKAFMLYPTDAKAARAFLLADSLQG